jgi:hypothetical protein
MFEYICFYHVDGQSGNVSVFADTIQEAEDKFECEYPQYTLKVITPMGEFSAGT